MNNNNNSKNNNTPNSNIGKGSKNRDFQDSINKTSEDPFTKNDQGGSFLDDKEKSKSNGNLFDKDNNTIGDELGEGEVQEDIVDKAIGSVKKKAKNSLKNKAILAGVILLSFVLLIGALVKMVEPITAFVGRVIDTGTAVVNAASDFFQRAKNLLEFGYFEGNEQTLFNMIKEKAPEFATKYGRPLNIPLIASAMYYDGDPKDKIEITIDENGNTMTVPIIDDRKLRLRVKYLDDVIDRLVAFKEYKQSCDKKLMETDKYKYVLTLVSSEYVSEIDESRTGRACNEENITKDFNNEDEFIYVYKETYDEDGFAYRLKNDLMSDGRSLIEHLFPERYEESESVDPIITEIIDYYEVWVMLYGKPDVEMVCYFPGSLSGEVMSAFAPPFKGKYYITSKFGLRPNPTDSADKKLERHNAIDIVAKEDTNIYAVADGIVVENASDSNGGNFVTIEHDIGGVIYYSLYKHQKELSPLIVGQTVSQGDFIGVMGSTGRSTGPHLHFAVYTLSGGKQYINPENLFSKAENYNYSCVSLDDKPVDSCTLNGAMATYAFEYTKSFNLIRALIEEDQNRVLMVDYDIESFRKLYDPSKSKNVINFDDKTIEIDGKVSSFEDPARNHVGRRAVLDEIGQYNESVYGLINIGFSQFSSSLYSQYGYNSQKEMFEIFNNNYIEYMKTIFNHIMNQNDYVSEVFSTIDSVDGALYTVKSGDTLQSISNIFGVTTSELLQAGESTNNIVAGKKLKISNTAAITGVIKSIFSTVSEESTLNRYVNDYFYIKRVIGYYESYSNNPTSTIENYINECLIVPIPDWDDCITWEDQGNCKRNLAQNRAAADGFLATAPTIAGKRVLAYGLSLWGKVRYCGACDLSNPECNFINPNTGKIGKDAHKYSYSGIRCSPWARSWGKEGFNPKWKELHTYYYPGTPYYKNKEDLANNVISYKGKSGTFTAGIAGLDCDGFVNWTLNQAFQEYETKTFPVMSTVCNGQTEYTIATQFDDVEGYVDFGTSIVPLLKPGDIICNSTSEKFGNSSQTSDPTWNYAGGSRHVMFFLGLEDTNGNMVGDKGDYIYVLHSSTYGVRVDKVAANKKDWLQYSSFATYK